MIAIIWGHSLNIDDTDTRYTAIEPGTDRTKDQITVDLHRTMAGHRTALNTAEGLLSLERVLGAVAMYYLPQSICTQIVLS